MSKKYWYKMKIKFIKEAKQIEHLRVNKGDKIACKRIIYKYRIQTFQTSLKKQQNQIDTSWLKEPENQFLLKSSLNVSR